MNMDFTIRTYRRLLEVLKMGGFSFQPVESFMATPLGKVVVMRHDVDRLPDNALAMAKLEHGMGVAATYYFRAVSESWDEGVIREIAGMGHEVGYHYESLTSCKGNMELAYEDFKRNLERLRRLAPVSTVCMHGSPLSGVNNLDLWKRYDFKRLGIVGEPYLDVDFDEVFYLTDTGRKWDGWKVSVRDKVKSQRSDVRGRTTDDAWGRDDLDDSDGCMKRKGGKWPRFHSTFDIIEAVEAGRFPDKVMMTVHPQRWDDRLGPWLRELVAQNVKNIIKAWMIRMTRFARDD